MKKIYDCKFLAALTLLSLHLKKGGTSAVNAKRAIRNAFSAIQGKK